jgi:hypothetical protein
MKRIFFLVLLICSVFGVYAQNNKSIVPMIAQTNDYISLIEQKYKQQVVHLEYDVILSDKEIYRQLFAGVQYGIIVFGDENVQNMNLDILKVVDDSWKIVASDKQDKGIVMVYFTPETTDFYKFNIKVGLKDNSHFSYYGFLLFR